MRLPATRFQAEDVADELALLRDEACGVALVGQRVAQQRYGAGGPGDVAVVVFTAMAEQYEHRERYEQRWPAPQRRERHISPTQPCFMRSFNFSLSGEYVRAFLWLLVAIEPPYGVLACNDRFCFASVLLPLATLRRARAAGLLARGFRFATARRVCA